MTISKTYRFAVIPEWVLLHVDLTHVDIRVYALLDRYGDQKYPSHATLSDRLGCSEDTVKRALDRLAEVGAVAITIRFTDEGRQTSNGYHLAGDQPLNAAPMRGGGSTAATHGGGMDAPQKRATRTREREPNGSLASVAPVRKRRPLFDALLEVCGIDYANTTDGYRKSVGVAEAQLAKVNATPDTVRVAAAAWRLKFPNATMTPTGIAKQYGQLLAQPSNGNVVKLSPGALTLARAAQRGGRSNNQ